MSGNRVKRLRREFRRRFGRAPRILDWSRIRRNGPTILGNEFRKFKKGMKLVHVGILLRVEHRLREFEKETRKV